MYKYLLMLMVCTSLTVPLSAQLKIGNNTQAISSAALMEVESTTKGVLIPRLNTVQRNAMNNPPSGLMIYNTDLNCIQVNNGTPALADWRCLQGEAAGAITSLSCGTAVHNGNLIAGVAVSGVSSVIPYSGGNGGAHTGQTVNSTGVTGLTATLSASRFIFGDGILTYTITGTPSGTGTASFAISIGGQTCTLTRTVSDVSTMAPGTGSFVGKSCFDIALSNDNLNACVGLTGRTPRQANFNLSATNTQTYTFTPTGTVSNVRFIYSNTNGNVITALSGGNAGANISTAVTATVIYNTNLNVLALGLTNNNPLTARIVVVYNDGAANNGTDRQLILEVRVKDCVCCGANTTTGVWQEFMCHNLGAETTLDPFTYVVGNADGSGGTLGYLYQWGRPSDGHQLRNSPVTSTLATSNTPGNNQFITTTANPYDWRSGSGENTRWGDGTANANQRKALNDPCPVGWKVPSTSQWGNTFRGGMTSGAPGTATANTWTWTGSGYQIGTSLFLPAASNRSFSTGQAFTGSSAVYWSSQVNSTSSVCLSTNSTGVYPGSSWNRSYGLPVRCVPE